MVTRGYNLLQEVTGDYKGLKGLTKGYRDYKGLLGFTGGYKGLLEATRGYKRVQGVGGVTEGYWWIQMGYSGSTVLQWVTIGY